jgi:transcriptional regulator with XRE-family HTH domain
VGRRVRTLGRVVGKNVRARRNGMDLTQEDVTKAMADLGVEVSIASMSRLEEGGRTPRLEEFVALAEALSTTTDELFNPLAFGNETPVQMGAKAWPAEQLRRVTHARTQRVQVEAAHMQLTREQFAALEEVARLRAKEEEQQ